MTTSSKTTVQYIVALVAWADRLMMWHAGVGLCVYVGVDDDVNCCRSGIVYRNVAEHVLPPC